MKINPKETVKFLLKNVAPTVATAFGTPLAGVATVALSNLLFGKDDAGEDEISKALMGASPETMLKLKELNANFEIQLKKYEVDYIIAENSDRDSARKREMEVKDKIPAILGIMIVSGFFIVLGSMFFFKIDQTSQGVFNILLGTLGTMTVTVISYYFGSSSGSRDKNIIIGKNLNK